MQALGTAIEMYHLDYNRYPLFVGPDGVNINPVNRRLIPLTTPIAYIAAVPQDPFLEARYGQRIVENQHEAYVTYDYVDAWSVINHGGNSIVGASLRCVPSGRYPAPAQIAMRTPTETAPLYNATNGSAQLGRHVPVRPANGITMQSESNWHINTRTTSQWLFLRINKI